MSMDGRYVARGRMPAATRLTYTTQPECAPISTKTPNTNLHNPNGTLTPHAFLIVYKHPRPLKVYPMTRLLLLTLLLPALASFAESPSAQIYRTTDEQGNVVFTDKPSAGVNTTERVELPPINTTPAPVFKPSPEPELEAPDTAAPAYSVAIISPANETSFPMGPGNFSVSVNVQPSPGENQALQLYIDDIPWGDPQQGTSWALTNIYRGEHLLTVAIVDAKGEHLANSAAIRVFVHRPSINFRNK
ncbi:MAG: hypothetical protein DRR04_07650 [Gammaproteobacteria bacterium]|nr:MAG: hypothetical protein DRR04_07650 [Gammaproteobacteria bacterium]